MAYVTQQDLIDRFGAQELIQLTDRDHRPATTIDTIVVDRAIADAGALADSYLAKRYQLPIAETPPILARMCADIARYCLWGKTAEAGGPIERAFKDAIAWLTGVAKGVVELNSAGVTEPQSGGAQVRFVGPDRLLSRETLRGFG